MPSAANLVRFGLAAITLNASVAAVSLTEMNSSQAKANLAQTQTYESHEDFAASLA